MDIDGYDYVWDIREGGSLMFSKDIQVITGNDAMWEYLTTGITQQEENTDGRTDQEDHNQQ